MPQELFGGFPAAFFLAEFSLELVKSRLYASESSSHTQL